MLRDERLRKIGLRSLFVLLVAANICAHCSQHSGGASRDLLTGMSFGKQVIDGHIYNEADASLQQAHEDPYRNLGKEHTGLKTRQRHGRDLLQSIAPAPGPAAPDYDLVSGVINQPSSTTVNTLVNNNHAEFGPYVCVDSCAHGNTCIWQNAWLWQCNGTNPTHHYWVWEQDTGLIRNAATDSFIQNPELCLDMCTDSRYGNGACAVTAQQNVLNVGYAECTGASNQQWSLKGTQIVNGNNSYCLSAGAQPCGRWADCNKSQAQTRQTGMLLNVFAEPCAAGKAAQAWSLGPAPNATLITFTPLNVSASRYPNPVPNLASQISSNSNQVLSFVNEEDGDTCLSIENQASCQSSQQPGSGVVLNPLSTVCVWKNALLQTCWVSGSEASADQQWIHDNSTKLIVLASDLSQNVCLEMCSDNSFANDACSLTTNNVGWASCSGSAYQQWEIEDGILYNPVSEMCINEAPLCLVDYNLFLNDPSAINRVVDNFQLSSCLTNIKNGPWAAMPYNGTAGPLGIRNLVGGPCDQVGNGTLRFTAKPASATSTLTDPIAPGVTGTSATTAKPGGSSSNLGAIVGGVVGGVVGLLAIVGILGAFLLAHRRKAQRLEYEQELKKGYYSNQGKGLDSFDSDILAPARSNGQWLEKLDLGPEINPVDIVICKKPEGGDWKLGEGAFGTVYKALRFGTTPVAVKVLREDSGKQIENFKREIELLRGLRDNNIVLFLGACKKDGQLMLVTEYMPQGDLWNAINKAHAEKFQWYQRGRKIALDVARGLVHLHSREIVHMDLKSPNILLGKDLTAKIADVGLARSVSNSYLSQMTSIGTMAWAAPELKRNFRIGRTSEPQMLTDRADVFSFGVVLWEIVTGEDPSCCSRNVKVPEECPLEVELVIRDCLQDIPRDRPDMKAVFDRLKTAANVPPPGRDAPLPTPGPTPAPTPGTTPGPTPPISRDGSVKSGPRSNRAAPRSGDYTSRLGLAAALTGRLAGSHYSSRSAPRSTLQAESILEDGEPSEVRERGDSAEEEDREIAPQ